MHGPRGGSVTCQLYHFPRTLLTYSARGGHSSSASFKTSSANNSLANRTLWKGGGRGPCVRRPGGLPPSTFSSGKSKAPDLPSHVGILADIKRTHRRPHGGVPCCCPPPAVGQACLCFHVIRSKVCGFALGATQTPTNPQERPSVVGLSSSEVSAPEPAPRYITRRLLGQSFLPWLRRFFCLSLRCLLTNVACFATFACLHDNRDSKESARTHTHNTRTLLWDII